MTGEITCEYLTYPSRPSTLPPHKCSPSHPPQNKDVSYSRRYKANIRSVTAEEAAATIDGLRPVWYTARDAPATSQGMYGLIAEETAEVDPTLVYWAPDAENPGAGGRPEAVHNMQLGLLLVQVAQQQKGRIAQLEARAAAAEARAEEMAARTAALEAEMQELRSTVAALAATAAARS
jgi:hypothetical protein